MWQGADGQWRRTTRSITTTPSRLSPATVAVIALPWNWAPVVRSSFVASPESPRRPNPHPLCKITATCQTRLRVYDTAASPFDFSMLKILVRCTHCSRLHASDQECLGTKILTTHPRRRRRLLVDQLRTLLRPSILLSESTIKMLFIIHK